MSKIASKELLVAAIEKGYIVKKQYGQLVIEKIGNSLKANVPELIDVNTTIYDIQEFLRDKQIYIEILTDCTTEPKFYYKINRFIGNPNDLTEKDWWWVIELAYTIHEYYLEKTYEDALESAINESLKIL